MLTLNDLRTEYPPLETIKRFLRIGNRKPIGDVRYLIGHLSPWTAHFFKQTSAVRRELSETKNDQISNVRRE